MKVELGSHCDIRLKCYEKVNKEVVTVLKGLSLRWKAFVCIWCHRESIPVFLNNIHRRRSR